MEEKEVMEQRCGHLARKLSPLNVWALAFGCIIGFGAFLLPGTTFLPNCGPLGTAISLAIAAGAMMVISLNYGYMIGHFAASGGELTYTIRAFGPNHAFLCAWFLGLSYLTIVPANATALALMGRQLLGGVFRVGYLYTVAGYDVYCGELLLAIGALLLFAWLSIRGVKNSGGFQTLLVLLLIGSVALVAVAAIVSRKTSWASLAPGFAPGRASLKGILPALAVAPFLFMGFDTVPQSVEEQRFSPNKTQGIMIVSILFGALTYVALNTVAAAAVPEGYGTWADYVAQLDSLSGIQALPTFYAAYSLLGTWGVALLGIAALCAVLSGICGFYMAASRLLYSMSREGVLPAWFGQLHPRYQTPYKAILFILTVSLVAPFFGRTALLWIVDMSSIGAAVGYAYTSAAAVKYAHLEKRPDYVISGLTGTALALLFAVLLLVPIPGLSCSLGRESYICLLVWIGLGIVFYLSARLGGRESGK